MIIADLDNSFKKRVLFALGMELSLSEVIDSCSLFSKKILELDYANRDALQELSTFCKRDVLEKRVKKELSGEVLFELTRTDFEEDVFEGWFPLGVIVHITPANSEILSFLAVIEGLLTGNVNILKASSNDNQLTNKALELLIECSENRKLEHFIHILTVPSQNKEKMKEMLSYADGVSVWGGDATIANIKEMMPITSRLIPWGHKISFAVITREMLVNKQVVQSLAHDVFLYGQQACSSPQCAFVEVDGKEELFDFAKEMGKSLDGLCSEFGDLELTIAEQAEITNKVEYSMLEALDGNTSVIKGDNNSWRVIAEYKQGLVPSPLNRTLIIRPITLLNLHETLFPLRGYLQTVGLSSPRERFPLLADQLLRSGATRVTEIGEMQASDFDEPHDGECSLVRFLKRVRAKTEGMSGLYRPSDLYKQSVITSVNPLPIMDKNGFQNQTVDSRFSDLFFRSGGSSGEPAISTFSYESYSKQMQAAAEGLYAAGLEPKSDSVMNLFFGGGLYGGFISFFSILEKLQVKQYPMGAYTDLKEVANSIVRHQVNVLVGMPSYLNQLFEANNDLLKNYNGVKKIFYGGEHFNSKQVEFLKSEFGVEVIRSASYGSVDAGPLGFQCPFCKNGEHHLNHSIQHLEILKINEDIPTEDDEIGRLVFTSKVRQSRKVERYDVGDLGRWISGKCECGREMPRFELLGRGGDIFRAGGTFFNYLSFQKILADKLEYSDEFQIVVGHDVEKKRDYIELRLLLTSSKDDRSVYEKVLNNYKDLNEAVAKEGIVDLVVEDVAKSELKRVDGTGKLKRVVDLRGGE